MDIGAIIIGIFVIGIVIKQRGKDQFRRSVIEGNMKQLSSKLIEDVSAASAAYLWNILPEIAKLPPARRRV